MAKKEGVQKGIDALFTNTGNNKPQAKNTTVESSPVEEMTKTTFEISKPLLGQFKATLAINDEKMRDVLTQMIKQYIAEKKG